MPVSAANYYNNVLANLEKTQADKQNDSSSDEDDLMITHIKRKWLNLELKLIKLIKLHSNFVKIHP